MMIKLLNVYPWPEQRTAADNIAEILLYEHLKERRPHEAISHKVMPTWEQHVAYVASRPHAAWYMIALEDREGMVGNIYLSHRREVGIHVANESERLLLPASLEQLLEFAPVLPMMV